MATKLWSERLEDLTSESSFEGKHFKIVLKKSNKAISFDGRRKCPKSGKRLLSSYKGEKVLGGGAWLRLCRKYGADDYKA